MHFRMFHRILVILAAIGLSSVVLAAHKAPTNPDTGTDGGPLSQECCAAVRPILQSAGGALTPTVRKAYLDWAEKTVLEKLRQSNQTVPEICLAEAQRDDTLRDAVFGSVFPPDPSILQNYAQLRTELGEGFPAKYRPLVIAIAVAKRIKGVEEANVLKEIGRDYQPGFWVDAALRVPPSEAEKDFVRHIASFMKASGVSALNMFQDETLQEQLKTALAKENVPPQFIALVKKSPAFGSRLKYAMVLLGQRPAAREPKPPTTAWLRHLVAIQEAKPLSTPTVNGRLLPWPLFPIDKALWPLLMPLAHSIPLSEADYIWEAFQGQHGRDRYHTYGPYRTGNDYMVHALIPSKWFWDAWPDRIVHGGECIDLSKMTVDLYSALGKPAMWAGQPGHSNLITFQYADGAWTAENEQAFAGGLNVTTAQWYFNEDPGTQLHFRTLYYWPYGEYHFGLVLAMNTGLKSYMDTRVAANLFRALPDADKPTLGVKLLRSVLQANPYNPAIWYRLAQQTTDANESKKLVEAANMENPAILFDSSGNMNVATKTVGNDAHEKKGKSAHHGVGSIRDRYWRNLATSVSRYSDPSHKADP